jgi:hypothetical protein
MMRCNLGNKVQAQYFGELRLNLAYLLLYLTTWRDAVVNSDDENREKIDPDKLRNRLDTYILSSDKAIVYEFFARYARKVYSDSDIKTDLKNNEGLSFVDKITPSDLALVNSVLKNGIDVWDQNIKMKQLGEAVHGDRQTKKWPLFTGGKGKKREQCKSLWSGEGLKYFKRAEKKWREVYVDNEKMQLMYGGFESWLNKYGKDITVRKNSNKTLHFVMARWTLKDNDISRKTLELECNISKGKEEEEDNGYYSDKGYNLLSKTWSIEERDKEKRNEGIDMDRTDKASRGNGNNKKEMRESGDEVHGRSFLLLRNRLDKGQQNMGSPAKGTRSTTRGDVGLQREGRGRKK